MTHTSRNNITASRQTHLQAPPEHRVSYFSEIAQLTIIHEAYNRQDFALGAEIAAEYVQGKDGIRNFQELFEYQHFQIKSQKKKVTSEARIHL